MPLPTARSRPIPNVLSSSKESITLSKFSGASFSAEGGGITDAYFHLDGSPNRQVSIGLSDDETLVTVAVSDAVSVNAQIVPILAFAMAEALMSAALTAWHRPGGPLDPKIKR
jgi:hypothetical protein